MVSRFAPPTKTAKEGALEAVKQLREEYDAGYRGRQMRTLPLDWGIARAGGAPGEGALLQFTEGNFCQIEINVYPASKMLFLNYTDYLSRIMFVAAYDGTKTSVAVHTRQGTIHDFTITGKTSDTSKLKNAQSGQSFVKGMSNVVVREEDGYAKGWNDVVKPVFEEFLKLGLHMYEGVVV